MSVVCSGADDSCIDCLDRTNVVQSALARHVLAQMLTQLGLTLGGSTVEGVFNDSECTINVANYSLGKQRRHVESVLRTHLGSKG